MSQLTAGFSRVLDELNPYNSGNLVLYFSWLVVYTYTAVAIWRSRRPWYRFLCFLVNQLFLFREGIRKVPGMSELSKGLKDEDLVALAKHFTALEAKSSEEKIDSVLVKRGEELAGPMRCTSCHLPGLAGQQQMPRLAKQRVDYLIHSLTQFRGGTNNGPVVLVRPELIRDEDELLRQVEFGSA